MESMSIKKNTFFNIIKTVSAIIFPLITFPYISRVLQPENVGKINFGNSIVSYISLIATLGITTYAIRECAKYKEDKDKLGKVSSQIFSINLVTTGIAYLILIVLLILYGKLRDYRLLIAIQSLKVFFTTIGADWLNTAMEDFKYITLRTLSIQILSLILMFVFIKSPDDYMKYAIITVLSASGANILNIFYRKRFCNTRFTLCMDIKKHLPAILSLFAMMLAQEIFTMCDTTIIGLTLGDYEVGLYSTALKVFNIINQVTCSIFFVVLPQLSVAYSRNKTEDYVRIFALFSGYVYVKQ